MHSVVLIHPRKVCCCCCLRVKKHCVSNGQKAPFHFPSSSVMGCTSSTPVDANAMLEKQREVMLQRQREFEQRRAQQQQQQPPPAGRAAAVVAEKSATDPFLDRGGGSRSPQPSPASLDASSSSSSQQPAIVSKGDQHYEGKPRGGSRNAEEKAVTPPQPQQQQPEQQPPNTIQAPPSSSIDDPLLLQQDDAALTAEVRRKYTIDPSEQDKRKSKNLHDYTLYGKKDFARRASLNPQNIELLQASLDQPSNNTNSNGAAAAAATAAITNDRQGASTSGQVIEEEAAGTARWTVVDKESKQKTEKSAGESASISLDDDLDPTAATAAVPSVNAADDSTAVPAVSAEKYLARDPEDRKSKNIHDYKLCSLFSNFIIFFC